MNGLDHSPSGISTDSARGPETTENNRHVSDIGRADEADHPAASASRVTVTPAARRWRGGLPWLRVTGPSR
jgi:hypothetical protein